VLATLRLEVRLKEITEGVEHLPHPITRVEVAVGQVRQEEHLQAQMVVMAAQELQAQLLVSAQTQLTLVVVGVEPTLVVRLELVAQEVVAQAPLV